MNPLQLRLAALRRRLRLVVTFRGVALVLVILLLAAVATGLLDWRLPGHLPSLVRAILLVGTLALGGTLAYRYLLRPLWANADDLSLALRVESRYPTLNDSFASAVQFLEQPARFRLHYRRSVCGDQSNQQLDHILPPPQTAVMLAGQFLVTPFGS